MAQRRDRKTTIKDLVPSTVLWKRLEVATKEDAIRALVNALTIQGVIDLSREDSIRDAILEREGVATTAIGNGVAIPHAKSKFADDFGLAAGIHPEGIEFGARDDQPVRLVFCWICPTARTQEHLALMRSLASLAQDPDAVERVVKSRDRKTLLQALETVEVEAKGK